MKVLTVVGARPQFIKAAMVSRELALHEEVEEVLVHTGQHFDRNMSEVFFEELGIPSPKVNLGIAGGTHAQMTGRMMVALENAIVEEAPDCVLLYGDTNSTLAGALAAAKLHIPVCHVEAGTRTRSMTNPEEINRVCADHVSSLCLACTEDNLRNLESEGLGERSKWVGDPMLDAFRVFGALAREPQLELLEGGISKAPSKYCYLTCHREENTGNVETFEAVLSAASEIGLPVVFPVHPRNARTVLESNLARKYSGIQFVKPVGYLESIYLVSHASTVITDSGGLQREAFFSGVKCTTVLDFEVWPETMMGNRNVLAKPTKESIAAAARMPQSIDPSYQPFGDGAASRRIADAIIDLPRS